MWLIDLFPVKKSLRWTSVVNDRWTGGLQGVTVYTDSCLIDKGQNTSNCPLYPGGDAMVCVNLENLDLCRMGRKNVVGLPDWPLPSKLLYRELRGEQAVHMILSLQAPSVVARVYTPGKE